MKEKSFRTLQSVLLSGVVLTSASATLAKQIVRETWDGFYAIGNLYPANDIVTNSESSIGFLASSPWITNPAQHDNNTLISIRSFFPEDWNYGLPPSYSGTAAGVCQDNSFPGASGPHSLWTDGDWMVRQLSSESSIDFNAEGEYFLAVHVGMDQGFAQYVGALAGTGAGGMGFADGTTTNANYVAIGVTGTNVFLGPPDASNPYGTINAGKSAYVSQGTLGQPGNTNTLLYHADGTLTNFTGGPYYIRAYSTNRAGLCVGDGMLILGHLVTHVGGNATIEVKFFNYNYNDMMDLTTNGITWDCSYSFNYTGTMNYMLLFENGEFPLYIYDFRVATTLADAVGMDAMVLADPQPDVYAGWALNLTNYTGLANPNSNPTLPGTTDYGTISYQWQQDGQDITGATNSFLNFASTSMSDPSMPNGTDAGKFTCVSTDVSGTWGSITSPPVNVTVTEDNVSPTISSLVPSADLSTLKFTFSEPVNGADDPAHYSISKGLSVSNATASTVNNRTIAFIATATQPQATKFTVTLSGVTDLAGNPLTPNTVSFWSHMYASGYVDYDAWVDSAAGYSANSYFVQYPLPTTPTPTPGYSANYTTWEATEVPVVPANGGPASRDTYGAKMYGWFIPPVTTNYVFFVSADDACRLSLSTNDSPDGLSVIAVEDRWSPADCWTNYSMIYDTGPHRGDGTSTNGVGTSDGGWDLGPDQNRSDEFIAAYNAEVGGLWPYAIGYIADVIGYPTQVSFWPTVDSNGNALITLQAGQKYYIQAEHLEEYGGANLSVTYKFANDPGDRANDPATGSTSIMTGNQIAALIPFQPSVSISSGAGGVEITYAGILAASSNIQGPYTDVPGATSPYHPTGGDTMFFRSHE